MKALYEMLRVARRGVLLIEPCDHELPDTAVTTVSRLLKNIVKRLLGRATSGHRFEELGNYVYGISRREMEKAALGAGLPAVAFRGINDYYIAGSEFAPADESNAMFREIRARIAQYDLRCRIGINQYGLLGTVILKDPLDPPLIESLSASGFDVVALPRSPAL